MFPVFHTISKLSIKKGIFKSSYVIGHQTTYILNFYQRDNK